MSALVISLGCGIIVVVIVKGETVCMELCLLMLPLPSPQIYMSVCGTAVE
jgi:hypothetical protein